MEPPHSITLADTLLRTIGQKEAQYSEDLRKNHALLKGVAVRLTDLPASLPMNEELSALLEEQKNVVRSLASENVARERTVRTFCQAVATIRERLGRGDESVFRSAANDLLPVDYQKAIEDMMAFHESNHTEEAGDLYDNELYRDIVDALGDPKPTNRPQKKASKRRRGREEEEDDDDDIEVMRPVETQASAAASLKCPISREFMTDAVQNSVCHHIYSRAGITGYIQQSHQSRHRSVMCPVVGCMNRNVALSQLTDHYETSRQAQKEVRLQSQRKAMQDEAANALMDSDDEQ